MSRKPFAAACALAVTVLAMFGLGMHAAYGHAALVSGVPSCVVDGTHHVTWTIGNDFNLAATVNSATTPAGTTVFTPALPALGTTGAVSTLPGTLTGTVVLIVQVTWSDGFSSTFSGSTFLPEPCPTVTTSTASTTTTTAPPSTSTTGPPPTTTSGPPTTSTLPPPVTSTSSPPDSTTTSGPPPSTSTSSPPDSTTTGPPPEHCTVGVPPCAQTGSSTGPLVGVALVGLFAGLALLFGSRYRRTVTGR